MCREPGVYWHMLPEREQARKAVWNNLVLNETTGRRERQIDIVFPKAARAETNVTEMRITLRNGSVWYLVGSDNYNSLVGTNPRGIVFSEYAIADPAAWGYLSPILIENGGWAWFIFTPRGQNHGYDLYQAMSQDPKNHCEILTVEDTKRPDGTPVVTREDIEQAKRDGLDEELVEQEFYCSFAGVQMGAYFAKAIAQLEAAGRVTDVPYDPQYPVETYWDLGIDDHTAVWFVQHVGFMARHIDHFETRDQGIEDVLFEVTQRDPVRKRYRYGSHHLPHDAGQREQSTGRGVAATLEANGWDVVVGENIRKADSVAAARLLLAHSVFDKTRCKGGLNALRSFQKKWDDKARTFLETPLHNWASHTADAFMEEARCVYGGVEDDPLYQLKRGRQTEAQDREPLTDRAPAGYRDDHYDPRGLHEGPMQLYAEDDG